VKKSRAQAWLLVAAAYKKDEPRPLAERSTSNWNRRGAGADRMVDQSRIVAKPPGCQRDMGFLQRALAELLGRESGPAHVEIDVERSVRGNGHWQSDPRQTVEDERAAPGEVGTALLADCERL
jgi:hypothetical protein